MQAWSLSQTNRFTKMCMS
jgi:hypothetical protein